MRILGGSDGRCEQRVPLGDASASEGMLPSLSAAAAGPLAFPRGKKRGHGQTDGTTTRGDHGGGADDLGARVDGGGIIEGGGGLPRQ